MKQKEDYLYINGCFHIMKKEMILLNNSEITNLQKGGDDIEKTKKRRIFPGGSAGSDHGPVGHCDPGLQQYPAVSPGEH
mgnify:CR=1 FL=1